MKAFGCDQRVERELLWAIKPKKKMLYVSTVYTVYGCKNLAEQ